MQYVALRARRWLTRAVAEVLIEVGNLLHAGCSRAVAVGHCAVDHIEARLPLIQPYLEVGSLGIVGEVHSVPFDVEDAVGRRAFDSGEDTTPVWKGRAAAQTYVGAQIVPVRVDDVGAAACVRQAGVGEDRERAHELKSAVGVHIRTSEGLIV